MTEPSRRRPLRDFAFVVALVLLAAVLFRLPTLSGLVAKTRLHGEANNSAHLPLFGAMALVMFGLSRIVFRARFSKPATHYWVAFGVAAVLAGGTELVQFFGPRDADLSDVALDLLGAGAALGLLATFDRRLAGRRIQRPGSKVVVRVTAALALVLVSVPVLLWAEAYRQRDARFPILSGFETYWDARLLTIRESELTLTDPPAQWNPPGGGRVGRWSVEGGSYPSFGLFEPYPDWRGFDSLQLSLYLVEDDPVRISITINDARPKREFTDRFTGRFVVQPGPNEIEIDLEDVRNSPELREMEMASIAALQIYCRKPPKSFTLYVDDLRLVSRAPAGPRPAAN